MFLYDARLEPSHSSVKRGILAATNLGSACTVVANITAQTESEFLPPWLSCPQKPYKTRWQQWTSSLKSAWCLLHYFPLHSPFSADDTKEQKFCLWTEFSNRRERLEISNKHSHLAWRFSLGTVIDSLITHMPRIVCAKWHKEFLLFGETKAL